MNTTVRELGQRLGVGYSVAHGIVSTLEAKGLAVRIGSKRNNQRGRGEVVWKLPTQVSFDFENSTVISVDNKPVGG